MQFRITETKNIYKEFFVDFFNKQNVLGSYFVAVIVDSFSENQLKKSEVCIKNY